MVLELKTPIINLYPAPGLANGQNAITYHPHTCGRYYELTEPRCSSGSF